MSNQELKCTHCQSEITHTLLQDEAGVFCCLGCQKVYHILNQSEFQTYHQLLELQDSKPPKARTSPKYQEYVQEWIKDDRWRQEGVWKGESQILELSCDEIHCAACTWLLEKQFAQQKGVNSIHVDFVHGRVKLGYKPEDVEIQSLLNQSAQLGYPLRFEAKAANKKIQKSTLIRIATSGAVMMNVMTFSYGGYFSLEGGMDLEWKNLFAILSAILNIPVVTYCSWPFYKKAYQGLKHRVLHMDLPISLGIILAYILSVYLTFEGGHPYFDSVSGLVFFLLVGRWFSQSFERWLTPDPRWFQNQILNKLERFNGSGWEYVSLNDLNPGDQFRLPPEQILPIQSQMLSEGSQFDSAWMTGESQAKRYQKSDIIPSGYRNLGGSLEFEARESYSDSTLCLMQNEWLNQGKKDNSKNIINEKIVPYFVFGVLLLSLLRGVQAYLVSGTLGYAIQEAIVVLIISCPCALALSQPISLGMTMKRARDLGYLLKTGMVLEQLKQIDTVIFDKTGTLTWTWHPVQKWKWMLDDQNIQDQAKSILKTLCERSVHPYALSLKEELGDFATVPLEHYEEIPGLGLMCQQGSQKWSFQSRRSLETGESIFDEYQNVLVCENKIIAYVQFESSIRPQVTSMIERLKTRNINVHLLSGDTDQSVINFAHAVGIENYQSQCTPQEKSNYCQELQSQGAQVLAIGDGMNDTLLLKQSDLSIVVQGGHYQVDDQTDIMSMGREGESLDELLGLPRTLDLATRRAYFMSLAYNVGVLSFAFLGFVAPLVAAIAMPMSTLSVVAIIKFTVPQK